MTKLLLLSLLFFCSFFGCLFARGSSQDKDWKSFRNEVIGGISKIPGWHGEEKASLMMDIIRENRCKTCVEIGVFAGASLIPIAKALQYNRFGVVVGIDPWDPIEATYGLDPSSSHFIWWNQINFTSIHSHLLRLIKKHRLKRYCIIEQKTAKAALELFGECSIDLIHFDGNCHEDRSFEDIMLYFPKVKDGGYIVLSNPNLHSLKKGLVFLLERTELLSPFSQAATYLLFRKNSCRLQNSSQLMIQ